VTYKVASAWGSGFTAEVVVRNTGTTAITGGWKLGFTFRGGERITSAWNATATQSGADVTVTNAAHNGDVPPGGTASFGFQGTGTPVGAGAFTLNGKSCA
jgi:cellulase/cellobiase CelA1